MLESLVGNQEKVSPALRSKNWEAHQNLRHVVNRVFGRTHTSYDSCRKPHPPFRLILKLCLGQMFPGDVFNDISLADPKPNRHVGEAFG